MLPEPALKAPVRAAGLWRGLGGTGRFPRRGPVMPEPTLYLFDGYNPCARRARGTARADRLARELRRRPWSARGGRLRRCRTRRAVRPAGGSLRGARRRRSRAPCGRAPRSRAGLPRLLGRLSEGLRARRWRRSARASSPPRSNPSSTARTASRVRAWIDDATTAWNASGARTARPRTGRFGSGARVRWTRTTAMPL